MRILCLSVFSAVFFAAFPASAGDTHRRQPILCPRFHAEAIGVLCECRAERIRKSGRNSGRSRPKALRALMHTVPYQVVVLYGNGDGFQLKSEVRPLAQGRLRVSRTSGCCHCHGKQVVKGHCLGTWSLSPANAEPRVDAVPWPQTR